MGFIKKINQISPIKYGLKSRNKKVIGRALFCIAGLFSVMVTISALNISFGFNVKYSGKTIATIRDTSVFANAKELIINSIENENAKKAIKEPKLDFTVTVSDKFSNSENLAKVIIKHSDEIVEGTALVVNGEVKVCAEAEDINKLIEKRKTAFYIKDADNQSEFIDKVEIKNGYYLTEDIKELSVAEKIINSLPVKTTSTVVSNKTIHYKTKIIKSSAYENGYHKIFKKGVDGSSVITTVKETVNGKSISSDSVSKVVISEPVEQVEVLGIAVKKISATARAEASSKGFIFPINTDNYKISSYFGDGRNHKGIDICADKGTPIFAVASGTVVSSKYENDYGYNVVIDHGNGLKTRYAHASALCVSAGEKVEQGDMIAAVGSTGYSTGNHVHFEVMVNGVRVNPAPYIGL